MSSTTSVGEPSTSRWPKFSCDKIEDWAPKVAAELAKITLILIGVLFVVLGARILCQGFPHAWGNITQISPIAVGSMSVCIGALFFIGAISLYVMQKKC